MTRPSICLLCALGLGVMPSLAPAQQATPVVPAGAKVELVYGEGFFLEGPAPALDGTIFFSDITNTERSGGQSGHIMRYDPATGKTTVYRSPSGQANGMIVDAQGRLVVTEGADFGARRVTRTDLATGRSTMLAWTFNGRRFNSPNDVTIDGNGRVYFTDPRYSGHETIEQPVMGVYRIDSIGSVQLAIADAGKPNGVEVSPDGKTLYVSSGGNLATAPVAASVPVRATVNALLAYDLLPDGSARFRKELVKYEAGPDGITVDSEGNIYATLPGPGDQRGVHVYAPSGAEVAFIPVPQVPSNVTFGRGADANMLYITARTGLYRIRLNRTGHHPK